MLQFTPSAPTPYSPTTPILTASGIFQYNSVHCLSSRRSKKRQNNVNPDTPAPKRLRKTTASSTPLSTIAISDFNVNTATTSCEFPGVDTSTGNDSESQKLTRLFAFLHDDLKWTHGELLYFTTKGKAPGALKDSGPSNKKDVH